MDFIIKTLVRRLENGKRTEPIVKDINAPVLYSKEAHEVMKNKAPDLFPEWNVISPCPFRIVKTKKTPSSYYWLREFHGIAYAIKIGPKSQFIAMNSSCVPDNFEEMSMSQTLQVYLLDCKKQTKEDTSLYVSVFYDADTRTLDLQTLNLAGKDIKNFPHTYWDTLTVNEHGIPCAGLCGAIRFVKKSEYEFNLGGLEVYDSVSLWTGSKVIKVFQKNDFCSSIPQMLAYWKNFWKACRDYL